MALSAWAIGPVAPALAQEPAANGQTPAAAAAGRTPHAGFEMPSLAELTVAEPLLQWMDDETLKQLELPDLNSLTPYTGRRKTSRATAAWNVSPLVRGVSASKPTLPLPAVPQPTEKAVGMVVGPMPGLSLSTEVASDDGRWGHQGTRMDWALTRQAPQSTQGFIWGGSASGGVDVQGTPSQAFAVSLGLRRGKDDGAWRVTPEVAVNSTYQPDNASRWGTTVKPSVAASARIFHSDRGWLDANIDTRVGYSIPVTASSAGQLDAAAMLRLTFKGFQ
ncbi:hypothetical protein ACFQU1_07060 [Chelatococcus sp. GCM10030263]|uniref:hypothetical protein n=1 Tax=Chelatococcus sp. GCM10030263 TaxID=3273387 RepID=UPI00361C85EC